MDPLEWKYMVMLAKETNLRKANELAARLKNIRQCNAIQKAGK